MTQWNKLNIIGYVYTIHLGLGKQTLLSKTLHKKKTAVSQIYCLKTLSASGRK